MKLAIYLLWALGLGVLRTSAEEAAETSLKNFQKEVEAAGKGGQASFEICEGSFASRRVDFVQVCWEAHTPFQFRDAFRKQPEGPFKDAVVLMMLRTASAWLDEGLDIDTGGVAVHHEALGNLITPEIVRYLPASEVKPGGFYSDKDRRALADRMEKAMGAKTGSGR